MIFEARKFIYNYHIIRYAHTPIFLYKPHDVVTAHRVNICIRHHCRSPLISCAINNG